MKTGLVPISREWLNIFSSNCSRRVYYLWHIQARSQKLLATVGGPFGQNVELFYNEMEDIFSKIMAF